MQKVMEKGRGPRSQLTCRFPELHYRRMSKPASAGYFDQGLKLARLGRWEEAASAYKNAFTADPSNAEALTNLGFVYYEMGLDQEAQDALSAASTLRASSEKCNSGEL
jgi:Flp pilus assembly protein TadD